jgi:SAM-dependent methyltransferase
MTEKKTEIPWYENWFDKNYLLLYKNRDAVEARTQIQLIIDTLKPRKDKMILDLGCGDGRYTHLFSELGFRIMGLDLSGELIREGRKKYGSLNLIVGDMRSIPGQFETILSLFTSFGYFNDDRDNLKVFQAIKSSLLANGWFWLDFLNPEFVEENLIPETVTEISSVCRVVEKRKILKNRVVKDIIFIQGQEKKYYQESVRLYSRTELGVMLRRIGIQPMGCFGDYQGKDWKHDSKRTIIYGMKRD